MIYIQGSVPQALAVLRDAAKVGLSAKKFVGNIFAISPSIPEQLGLLPRASVPFRLSPITAATFGDEGNPLFQGKERVAKQDIYYMRGWLEGAVMAKAIEAAIAGTGQGTDGHALPFGKASATRWKASRMRTSAALSLR